MSVLDDINRELRDFNRDGDPQSGVYNISKAGLRGVLIQLLQTQGDEAALQNILAELGLKASEEDVAALRSAFAEVPEVASSVTRSTFGAPDRLPLTGDMWPLVEQGSDVLAAIDRLGRLRVTDVALMEDIPAVLTSGVIPLQTDGAGVPFTWFDPQLDRVRMAGDDLDRAEGVPSPFSVVAGRDVLLHLGAEGQVYQPAAARAPVVYVRPVNDGGGAIQQVHLCDGQREWRLTASQVDCHAPVLIAPGIVRYARLDGVIGIVRAPRDPRQASARAEMHVLFGQSLAGGSTSYAPNTPPIVAHAPSDRVLMFNGGVRSAYGDAAPDPDNYTALVPAFEKIEDTNRTLSETGMASCGFALTRETLGRVIVNAAGLGGVPYSRIRKGTQPWANMVYGVERAHALAAGGTTVAALHWRHGESEETATAEGYTAIINQAHADFIADVMPITGQASAPVMVLQQIGRMEATGEAGVAAYRLEGPGWAIANIGRGADATKIVAAPQYICDFGDQYHMMPDSYVFMASHVAKALRRHRVRRWQPLHAVAAVRTGRAIDITFSGGWLDWGGSLVLDTSWVSDPGQFGFAFRDGTNSAKITGVHVIDQRTIRVILDARPSGAEMSVGIGFFSSSELDGQGRLVGLRCCLRDNDPDGCPVTGRPLHNYPIGQAIGVS